MQHFRLILMSWLKDRTNQIFLVLVALILIFSYLNHSPKTTEPVSTETADTIIPFGHVLLPIEIANIESLDSIFGDFGVVDLFSVSGVSGKRAGLISSNVKLLRAPLDPKHFALLVPEQLSQKILQYEGPYFIVVKNPKQPTEETKLGTPIPQSRIRYFN